MMTEKIRQTEKRDAGSNMLIITSGAYQIDCIFFYQT